MFYDRVQETTTTTGTGNVTLAGAVSGFQTFDAAAGVGPFFRYAIFAGAEWEVGIGHLSASTTLVRDVVEESSNSDALVSFSAGPKTVISTFSAKAARAMYAAAMIDASQTMR